MNKKSITIITVLLFIIMANAYDLIDDLTSGEPTWHIIMEGMVITSAITLIIFLISQLNQKSHSLNKLQLELNTVENELTRANDHFYQARKEYSQVIQQQFEDWSLSKSEQEIALPLLKGLSFNEIAMLRNTKEKTVRQQASEIYRKSGASGRHLFSAWFFEDFLN